MWLFKSPEIVYGEGALDTLEQVSGRRAFIVTDANMVRLGFAERVADCLHRAGMETQIFAEVEPNPTYQVVLKGKELCTAFGPDWVVGLGGGSAMDASKAIYVLYERPDMEVGEINPLVPLGLGKKARLMAIPTTSGTGAETTWLVVLTDQDARKKTVLGSRENVPHLAIVDPSFTMNLPPAITADTGMDALTHAVEGYTSIWRNDFSDGLCLAAIRLVFSYLPQACVDGGDAEAREKMHNAATIAGLGFGNSNAALAHALGHPMSPAFGVPHGRAVGLFLPYTIEFTAECMGDRYAEIARFIGLPAGNGQEGAASLAQAVRDLAVRIGQPLTIADLGISYQALEAALPKLVEDGMIDTTTSARCPDDVEMEKLYRYAYEGKTIDF
ncbi:MAG: iron-containing alcohol dehydrogenase [Anaerolineae bacterium]|nr:iron-containing alcohol dehydrogenase [Anaerolineae bacterium]